MYLLHSNVRTYGISFLAERNLSPGRVVLNQFRTRLGTPAWWFVCNQQTNIFLVCMQVIPSRIMLLILVITANCLKLLYIIDSPCQNFLFQYLSNDFMVSTNLKRTFCMNYLLGRISSSLTKLKLQFTYLNITRKWQLSL